MRRPFNVKGDGAATGLRYGRAPASTVTRDTVDMRRPVKTARIG